MLRFACILLCCSAAGDAQSLSFDVASIKPSQSSFIQVSPQRSGGHVSWLTMPLVLIEYAYDVDAWRISGLPAGSNLVYQISATMPADATDEQVRQMFQSLLRERFQLAFHREQKQSDGFALTAAKAPKLKEMTDSQIEAAEREWAAKRLFFPTEEGRVAAMAPSAGIGAVTARRASMAELAKALGRTLRTFVEDETGIAGRYFIAFEYALENHPAEVDLPLLPQALQENLGLKLERRKGAIETLVVDHIEKTPTEN